MPIVIYKFTNSQNGKSYIGQTGNIKKRRQRHIFESMSKQPTLLFHRALKKYGIDLFEFSILESGIHTRDKANLKEIYFIEKFDSFNNGYNLTEGGGGMSGRSGEHCPNSKISENDAIFIINDSRSKSEISKILDISVVLIDEIRRNKTWRHITRPEKIIYQHGNSSVSDNVANLIINDPCSHDLAAAKYDTEYHIVTSIRLGINKKHLDRSHSPRYQMKKKKLYEADAINIVNSPLSNTEMAKLYSISKDTVSNIRCGRRWKHIDRTSAPDYNGCRGKRKK